MPEESPYIKFHADPSHLHNSIREFGQVDADSASTPSLHKPLSPLDAFPPSHVGAASLPNAFEDYEDEDHHVLYKTLQGVGAGGDDVGTHTVSHTPL